MFSPASMIVTSRLAMYSTSAASVAASNANNRACLNTTQARFSGYARNSTLSDLMHTAASKSRRLSSPKSRSPLRNVVLQNRMVNVINAALVANPLSLPVRALDKEFITAPAREQQQQQQRQQEKENEVVEMMQQEQEQEQYEEVFSAQPMLTECDSEEVVFDILAESDSSAQEPEQFEQQPAVMDSFPADIAEQLEECARQREQQAVSLWSGAQVQQQQQEECEEQEYDQGFQDSDDGSSGSSSSASASSSSSSGSSGSDEDERDDDGSGRARRKRARKARRFNVLGSRPIQRPCSAPSAMDLHFLQQKQQQQQQQQQQCAQHTSAFGWGQVVDASTLREIASC